MAADWPPLLFLYSVHFQRDIWGQVRGDLWGQVRVSGISIFSWYNAYLSNNFLARPYSSAFASATIFSLPNRNNIPVPSLSGATLPPLPRDSGPANAPFYISSSGHLCRLFNLKILSVALLRLRFCSISAGQNKRLPLSHGLGDSRNNPRNVNI